MSNLVTLEKTDLEFSIAFYCEEKFMGVYFVNATYSKVRRL